MVDCVERRAEVEVEDKAGDLTLISGTDDIIETAHDDGLSGVMSSVC